MHAYLQVYTYIDECMLYVNRYAGIIAKDTLKLTKHLKEMRSHMPKTVRITDSEEKALNKKCVELNKALISKNKMPVRESELVHLILEIAIKNIRIDKTGEIYIDV